MAIFWRVGNLSEPNLFSSDIVLIKHVYLCELLTIIPKYLSNEHPLLSSDCTQVKLFWNGWIRCSSLEWMKESFLFQVFCSDCYSLAFFPFNTHVAREVALLSGLPRKSLRSVEPGGGAGRRRRGDWSRQRLGIMAAPLGRDTLPDHWSYGVCRDGRVFFTKWAVFNLLAPLLRHYRRAAGVWVSFLLPLVWYCFIAVQ